MAIEYSYAKEVNSGDSIFGTWRTTRSNIVEVAKDVVICVVVSDWTIIESECTETVCVIVIMVPKMVKILKWCVVAEVEPVGYAVVERVSWDYFISG